MKEKNNTAALPINTFAGFSQRQHGAKTILKAIDGEDHMVNSFGKPAIGPSRDGGVLRSLFGPVFFCFFFVLLGLSDSARPISKYLKGCQVTPL